MAVAPLTAERGLRMSTLRVQRAGLVVAAPRPWSTGSAVVAHGLSTVWRVGSSWIEPVSHALAGRFLTTEPLGKPSTFLFDPHCTLVEFQIRVQLVLHSCSM